MDRVGGYCDYLALRERAQDYDDVLLALAGEADAAKILKMQRDHA